MRKIKLTCLGVLTVMSIVSCSKILDELLTFSVKTSSDFKIPGSAPVGTPLSINTPEINSSSSEDFSDNGSSSDLVKSAKLDKLTMTITSPDNVNFDFLNEIKLYINADGLDEMLIASKTDIPDTEDNIIELETTDTDIAEYIKKDSYSIRIDAITDKLITQEINITADMVFKVTADPL